MTHLDPDYTICGINDPFLVITLLKVLMNSLNLAKVNNFNLPQTVNNNIEKLIIYCVSLYKPNKKIVNSVLY